MYLVVFFAVGEMRDVGVNVIQAAPAGVAPLLFPLDARWGPGLGTPGSLGPVNSLILILCLLLTWLQYLEGAHQSLVYTHHPPGVVKLSAVVGGGEQGDQLSLREKLVTILHDLMSSAYQVQIVSVEELGDDISPECETHPSVVFSPSGDILVGV